MGNTDNLRKQLYAKAALVNIIENKSHFDFTPISLIIDWKPFVEEGATNDKVDCSLITIEDETQHALTQDFLHRYGIYKGVFFKGSLPARLKHAILKFVPAIPYEPLAADSVDYVIHQLDKLFFQGLPRTVCLCCH